MKNFIHVYRFELLLFGLMMVIFNKIFFFSAGFYTKYVWPLNMLLLGIVSVAMFKEWKKEIRWFKNLLFLMVVLVPLLASYIFSNRIFTIVALMAYMTFYSIIFIELMRQIIKKSEVTESVIIGSLSGFLLIIIVCSFSFLLIGYLVPHSFNSVKGETIPDRYHQIVYFSSITLSTIGYGDISPANDQTRLLAAFWGIIGQFYMVAVVGIIISKFTSKSNNA